MRGPALTWLGIAATCLPCCRAGAAAADALRITVAWEEPAPNLVPNPSFEDIEDGVPRGWRWDPRNTDAALTLVDDGPRSGLRALKITNGTMFGAHVYGWLGLAEPVRVEPEQPYVLSCYVRADDPGLAWIGGGQDWNVRLRIPPTGGAWQRVSHVFHTRPDEHSWTIMVVSESPTVGIYLDDVKLEAGEIATPFDDGASAAEPFFSVKAVERGVERAGGGGPVDPADRWNPDLYPPESWLFIGPDGRAAFAGIVELPRGSSCAELEARILKADGEIVAAARRETGATGRRFGRLGYEWQAGTTPPASCRLEVRAESDTGETLERRVDVRVVSAAQILRRRDDLARRWRATSPSVSARVPRAVVGRFLPWVEDDVRARQYARAYDACLELEDILERLERKPPDCLLEDPVYVTGSAAAGGGIEIRGGSFIADTLLPGGPRERRPVFFVGYGHFGQVRADVERFPDLGSNLIQVEFGPSSVFPAPDTVDLREVDAFVGLLDRAAAANVAVNLLISPHYFPGWALDRWPVLRQCRGNFCGYCIHAAEGRDLLAAYIDEVIPRIAGHPALHSICLSNEPGSIRVSNCPEVVTGFRAWLRAEHGDMATLNRRWDSAHESFDEITPPEEFGTDGRTYDFCRYNSSTLAAWHRMLADRVRDHAPGLPVHAKIMTGLTMSRGLHGPWSVDPERFAAFCGIHGNDCWKYPDGEGVWANGFLTENMAYDFQRSFRNAPVFNSENHLIPDGFLRDVPAAHIRNVLWQGAVHGQGATTLWVWERTNDRRHAFAGSILHRPLCVEAAGETCRLLNRCAREVSLIQDRRPSIGILWSLASAVAGQDHERWLREAYLAANFVGESVGFVTEPMLAEAAERGGELAGRLAAARWILVPAVTRWPEASVRGLRAWADRGGEALALGPTRFDRGAWGETRKGQIPVCSVYEGDAQGEAIHTWLVETLEQEHPCRIADAEGDPPFGVEWRVVPDSAGWLVNVCNYRSEPVAAEVRTAPARSVEVRDLITGRDVGEGRLLLPPLEPMLLRVGHGPAS